MLPVGALRDLVGRAAAERSSEVVFRGRLITHQLLTNRGQDYPFPPQVQVTRLAQTAYQVTTEFMVWQQGDCVRQELLDGSPVMIHNGQTRWKVYYWPTDTFYREDAPGTALREDDYPQVHDDLRLPPLPADHARLLAGVDPIGEVTAGWYRDTAAWKFTMPIDIDPRDPRRDQPGYTSIIAAGTGYLLNRPGVSGHSSCWERWSHGKHVEEVPG